MKYGMAIIALAAMCAGMAGAQLLQCDPNDSRFKKPVEKKALEEAQRIEKIYQAGEYAEVVAQYRALMAKYPGTYAAEAASDTVRFLLAHSDFDWKPLRELERLQREMFVPALGIPDPAQRRAAYERFRSELHALLKRYPTTSLRGAVFHAVAVSYQEEGNYSRAVDYFSRAAADPDLAAAATLQMARLYEYRLANRRRAVELYEKYLAANLAVDPFSCENIVLKVFELRQELGQHDRAARFMTDYLTRNPDMPLAGEYWLKLAELYKNRYQFLKEQEIYRHVAQRYREPGIGDRALYAIGFQALTNQNFERAAEVFAQLEREYPKSAYLPNIARAREFMQRMARRRVR
jgi:tetratricopeptide (TPR) repeat protein